MTQAPTPGPLTAAIDMLSEARDFIDRFSDVRDGDYGTSEPNAAMVMVHEINATIDQISAPTAPVEASGSEQLWSVGSWLSAALDDPKVCDEMKSDIRDWFDNGGHLRPQPSGETRDINGETFMGFRVAAWRYRQGDETEKLPHHYAEHWSTPGASAWGIQRLITEDQLQQALSARPLALGGQQGEDAAWSWLNQHVECDPADRDYSADEMVDAFMAGAGRYDIWLKALERIAGEHQYRSGYCQTDITVEPALTAEEAQTVARDALSTTPARAEAQDEGAALSASDRACYEYPGKDQSDLRAAFVAGACFIAALASLEGTINDNHL